MPVSFIQAENIRTMQPCIQLCAFFFLLLLTLPPFSKKGFLKLEQRARNGTYDKLDNRKTFPESKVWNRIVKASKYG